MYIQNFSHKTLGEETILEVSIKAKVKEIHSEGVDWI